VHISAFQRCFTFSVLVGRFPRSAKFPLFLMIEGLFTIYYSFIWRAQIDERCMCLHYEDILHFLVLGGLSFISVSSSPFFIIKGSFTTYSSVDWRNQRDKRLTCLHCGDISHSLFWWAGTLGQSNFHRFLWSKAHLQSTIVSLQGLNRWEVCVSVLRRYFTFSGFGGVKLYLSQFSTSFHHWKLVYIVLQCHLKDQKRPEDCVSAFQR